MFLGTMEDYLLAMLRIWDNQILEEAHGTCCSIYTGATKIYHDLREVYWWDGLK